MSSGLMPGGVIDNTQTDDVDDSNDRLRILVAGAFPTVDEAGSRTFTGVSAKTAELTAGRYLLSADKTCHVNAGASGSVTAAVGSAMRVPADTIVGLTVTSGQAIAAIQESAAGTLYWWRCRSL